MKTIHTLNFPTWKRLLLLVKYLRRVLQHYKPWEGYLDWLINKIDYLPREPKRCAQVTWNDSLKRTYPDFDALSHFFGEEVRIIGWVPPREFGSMVCSVDCTFTDKCSDKAYFGLDGLMR